jgi:hypothetical protein
VPQLTKVTSDVISTNTISGLISAGFTSMNVATMGTQTIEFGSSNTLVFQANTSLERMRIAANGDIGIGTTTPNSRLTINKNSGSPATIAGSPYFNIVGANADSPRLQFDAYGTGALTLIVFRKANGTLASPSALNSGDQIGNISAWGYGATGYSTSNRGYISFFADEAWTDSAQGTRIVFATATAGAASPGVERMRITANGDVGIATTAPAQRLHIGLTGANNYIQFGTTNEGFVIGRENSTGEFTFDATQASPYNVFRWRQSGTERMRIASSGNVGIGTSSPSNLLDVRGASTPQIIINNTSAGSNDTTDAYLATYGGTTPFWSRLNYNASQHIWRTYNDERMRMDGATLSLTGLQGIKFQATQSASSDANTLDDYEEGTWTPQAWQGSTQITSPSIAYGRYIKVGNVIWIGMYFFKPSGAPSASGQWQIRGLPFSVSAVQAGVNAVTAGYNGMNGTESSQKARWQANSTSALELYGQFGSTSWTSSYVEFSFSGCLEAG